MWVSAVAVAYVSVRVVAVAYVSVLVVAGRESLQSALLPRPAAGHLDVRVVRAPVADRLPRGHLLARSIRSTIPIAGHPSATADRSLADAWQFPLRMAVV